MDYEHAWVIDDIATWFAGTRFSWDWVAVRPSTLTAVVEDLSRLSARGHAVAVNLCDGDDVNGYPGLSVVLALEAAGIDFTGAGSAFYALSTSKLGMKIRLARAGLPTSPWRQLVSMPDDLARAAAEIGLPLFIKPDISAAAAGIGARSVIHDVAAGADWVARLRHGMHGFQFQADGIFAERFLPGREFSVLVVADADASDGVRAFAPCERVFPPALRPEQRFVTFERNYGGVEDDTAPEDSGFLYAYGPVEPALHPTLGQLAIAAFVALGGDGYGRVDLRLDHDGRPVILEVNANCGLTAEATTSTVGAILNYSGSTMGDMLRLMVADAPRRGTPLGQEAAS
jgi:D-alanine-D-alanine ligase